ncbi:MAG: response regulator transcription factor, partial [bacterium]
MSNIIHVIIADAQYLTRAGLLQLCASTPSLKVVGEASDAKELLDLAKSKHPDVVVIDYNHPEVFPLDVLVDLKRNSPQTKCLI